MTILLHKDLVNNQDLLSKPQYQNQNSISYVLDSANWIIAFSKEVLCFCTYFTRMDFLYELTWRKERGFISASDYYLRQALNVWKSNTQPEEMEANEKWYFVGIFLLKQYREKMDWSNWKSV